MWLCLISIFCGVDKYNTDFLDFLSTLLLS